MPKLKGPLLSLAATGTFRGLITYVTHPSGARCTKPHARPKSESPLQHQHRERVSNAAAAWTALDEAERDAWRTCGAVHASTGYALYWREYVAQVIVPPGQPVSPCEPTP